MSESLSTASTLAKSLFILIIVALSLSFMWEIAKNLWLNWGTSSFWESSLVAALVGMLGWWLIGLVAYLSMPKSVKGTDTEKSPAPAVNQSATASGGSTINQAGRDVVINQGITESTVLKLLSKKAILANTELAEKYPLGFVLMGIANGKVIFQPESPVLEFDPDNKVEIKIDEAEQKAWLGFSFFRFATRGFKGITIQELSIQIDYVENVPKSWPFGYVSGGMKIRPFAEILDRTNRVFVIGFKLDK